MAEKLSHKERTRLRILDEAASLIQVRGSDGIGVAEVMKRAGLTHGGFYAHFSSRDDLIAQSVDHMLHYTEEMIEEHKDDVDPVEGLTSLFDYYLSEDVRENSDRACPMPRLAGEARSMPDAARSRFDRGMQDFQSTIEAALTALGRDDPETMAMSVLSEMVGAMALARATPDNKIGNAILSASRLSLKKRLGLIS